MNEFWERYEENIHKNIVNVLRAGLMQPLGISRHENDTEIVHISAIYLSATRETYHEIISIEIKESANQRMMAEAREEWKEYIRVMEQVLNKKRG